MFKIFRLIPYLLWPFGRAKRRAKWARTDIKKAMAYVSSRKKSIADLKKIEFRSFYAGENVIDFFGAKVPAPATLCGMLWMDSDGDLYYNGSYAWRDDRVSHDHWHIGRFSKKAIMDKKYKWTDLVMVVEPMKGSAA